MAEMVAIEEDLMTSTHGGRGNLTMVNLDSWPDILLVTHLWRDQARKKPTCDETHVVDQTNSSS